MSEELLIRYCSPTLAGLKTGNLFTAEYQSVKQAMEEITRLNQFFVPRGLRILPMRVMGKRMLIYLYRPGKLEQDFASPNVGDMLKAMGYPWGRTEQCVVCLFKRLRKNQEFPHEIGLFLGYPIEDVQGFIQNKAQHYKCSGVWKVYGDADLARKKFRQYRICTENYYARWKEGCSIQKLTVASH